jgi:hypothetical protein
LKNLPENIFDFKFIVVEGARGASNMPSADYQAHLSSFGLELIHARFAFCRKCTFPQSLYTPGDTLVFDYFGKTYVTRVQKILEENLMEVEPIQGNEEKVIIVERYWVVGKERGARGGEVIEWKADSKRFPKVKLRGGNYAYSEENLEKTFKEGDQIVFLELGGGQLASKRDRKVHGPVFEVGRFLGNGFAMELKPDRLYPEG